MKIERHVLTTPGDSGLKMVANRYRPPSSNEARHGVTLLLTHCIGAHKEQWEPLIESLFVLQRAKDRTRRVREVWAFDWQSHGDSAVVNRNLLDGHPYGVSAFEWALAISAFLRSSHVKGHRWVAIGHSAGAAAIMLTTKEVPINELHYCAMILIEPTMVTRQVFNAHLEDRMASMDFAVTATSARRDTWKSRNDAFKYFSRRVPWESWDPRVVRILTEYGLEDTPSGQLTLKCDRRLEASSYPDVEPHFEGAVQLGKICHSIPVHVIWGDRYDLVPEFIQHFLSDTSEGRTLASVTRIQDTGHLIVQEKPERLAHVISGLLDTISAEDSIHRSRL